MSGVKLSSLPITNLFHQLCRIILTHHHPSTRQITFQQLLSSTQFVNATSNYLTSCARILETVASSSRLDDYQESTEVIAGSLLTILVAVSESQDVSFVEFDFPREKFVNILYLALIHGNSLRPPLRTCSFFARFPVFLTFLQNNSWKREPTHYSC